jgi:3-deoxy-manno-octulosonate cytidylyltransferase (CMP-KDO synthetase)
MSSTRLPGKPLIDICGKPMIQWVHEKAITCGFDSVLIATDDLEIKRVVESFGAAVCMTSAEHVSGTDRIAEAAKISGYGDQDIIVNIQGDEPLISARSVNVVADNLAKHPLASVSTLCEAITSKDEIFNINNVKVVLSKDSYALYFSRAPIPWDRDRFPDSCLEGTPIYRHIGIYAYRGAFLNKYSDLEPCFIEKMESLEQLRVLWHGQKIHVGVSLEKSAPGVDTELDLDRVRSILKL